MPSWLTKAKAAFKTPEPRASEPYRLVCVCGEMLAGMRGEREQRLTCPQCDFEMFVLPDSVYPPPDLPVPPLRKKVPPPQKPKSAEPETTSPTGPAGEILLEAEPQQAPAAEKRAAAVASQTVDVDHLRGIRDLRPASRKIFTPFRGLLVGISVVILLTGYAIIHSRNLDRAQIVLVEEEKAGRAALQNDDISLALEHFEKVNGALGTLGTDDAQSRELRQLFWELRAANGLSPNPLHEMISEAVQSYDMESSRAWKDLFDFTYQGKWIVLEAPLPEESFPPEILVKIPVILPGETAVISVTGENRVGANLSETARHVIFAGQLESCLPEETTGRNWVIRLNPQTAFLWSNAQTYRLLGFQPDEEAENVLVEQSSFAGGGP